MAAAHDAGQPVTRNPAADRIQLGDRAWPLYRTAMIVAGVGFLVAIVMGFLSAEGFRRFYFAYLVGFAFCLSLALGALFFVLIQHLTRAGWSVGVRRIAESLGATMPILAALSVPILFSVVLQKGDLYRWALPAGAAVMPETNAAHAEHPVVHPEKTAGDKAGAQNAPDPARPAALDPLTAVKRAWLNPTIFVVRILIYFGIWCWLARYVYRLSVLQDQTGDAAITARLQWISGPGLVLLAITLTGGALDLLMSLDPHWYSTMFGVYYFAGCAVAIFAALIIITYLLQRAGYLPGITIEHYHDLGKFLFGFVFFWGYIAFSQYMLLWYSSIPEEIEWFKRRGATTSPPDVNGWSWVIIAILFGHLLIPFAGLLSRHVKRVKLVLVFWAVWLLVFHFIDMCWVVIPEVGKGARIGIIDVAALLGVGGLFVAATVRVMAHGNLRPTADPRLAESLAFQNI